MGYPWSDGFSLIENDLNPAIDHTSLPLYLHDHLVCVASSYGQVNASGTAATTIKRFYTANLPSTASWAINLTWQMAHLPTGVGDSTISVFFNGTKWNTLGSAWQVTSDSWAAKSEDIYGVGPGSITLVGSASASTGSTIVYDMKWNKRPVYLCAVFVGSNVA